MDNYLRGSIVEERFENTCLELMEHSFQLKVLET